MDLHELQTANICINVCLAQTVATMLEAHDCTGFFFVCVCAVAVANKELTCTAD